MKVALTLEFTDDQRRAIAAQTGERKIATRADVRAWIEKVVESTLEDAVDDYEKGQES